MTTSDIRVGPPIVTKHTCTFCDGTGERTETDYWTPVADAINRAIEEIGLFYPEVKPWRVRQTFARQLQDGGLLIHQVTTDTIHAAYERKRRRV